MIGLRLFLIVFITYAYFSAGAGHNEAARFDTIRAVLEDRTLSIDRFVYNSADVIRYQGHYYSSKAPGTALMGLVPFALFDRVLRFFHIPEFAHYHLVVYLVTVVTISLLGALTAPLIYGWLRRRGARKNHAMYASLAICLGTMFFPFSLVFFSHVATAALAFLGYCLVDQAIDDASRFGSKKLPGWPMLLAGFTWGFTITLEYPAAIFVLLALAASAYTLYRRSHTRSLFALCLGVFLGVAPLLLHNVLAFGNAFYLPYEAYAQDAQSTFAAHQKGILGIRIPFLEPSFWPIFLHNLAQITYLPLRGVFYLNPGLIMSVVGFALLLRSRHRHRLAEIVFIFGLAVVYFAFNASYGDSIVYWGGGASFGPRHIMIILPFLALPLLAALENKWTRPLTLGLIAVSTFFCLMAAAIEPRTPYTPENPIWHLYWPSFVDGQLSQTDGGVFSKIPMTAKTVAFNWGWVLGLPGPLQLWPLYLTWLAGAFWLDRNFGRAILVLVALLVALPAVF